MRTHLILPIFQNTLCSLDRFLTGAKVGRGSVCSKQRARVFFGLVFLLVGGCFPAQLVGSAEAQTVLRAVEERISDDDPITVLEQRLTTIEDLQKRNDPVSRLIYAKRLLDGIPANAHNPLLIKDPQAAKLILEQIAKEPGPHQSKARFLLAREYARSARSPQDVLAIQELLAPLIADNDPKALTLRGTVLAQRPDAKAQALADFQLAARLGYMPALLEMASIREFQDAVDVHSLTSFALLALEAEAETGSSGAAYRLGKFYHLQTDEFSRERARKWFSMAAQRGHTTARYRLSEILLEPEAAGRGGVDPQTAYELALAAANSGHIGAARSIVENYSQNGAMPVTGDEFARWVGFLLEVNDMRSIGYYAHYLEQSGQDRTVFSDLLFAKASSGALKDADDVFQVGKFFASGHGVNGNLSRALQVYQRAYDMGAAKSAVRAATIVLRSPSHANEEILAWIRSALAREWDAGDDRAAIALGDMYRDDLLAPDEDGAERFATARATYEQALGISVTEMGTSRIALLLLSHDQIAIQRQALPWLESAVKLGNDRALLYLARIYREGRLVDEDKRKALSLFNQAAEAGNVDGLLEQAELSLDLGDENAFESAHALFRRAIEHGNTQAPLAMARFLVRFEQKADAVAYFEKAAGELRQFLAAMELHRLLKANPDLGGDPSEWLELAVETVGPAADERLRLAKALLASKQKGYASVGFEVLDKLRQEGVNIATHVLAKAYLNGTGTSQNVAKGVALLEEALQQNDATAATILGSLYMDGKVVESDGTKARNYLARAVELDPSQSHSHYRLGRLYATTKFGHLDISAAQEHLRASAELGDLWAAKELADVKTWLPKTEELRQEIETLLTDAGRQGLPQAWAGLSRFHGAGMAKKIDRRQAFLSIYRAAQEGHGLSMIDVGVSLIAGFGAPRNVEAGIGWLEKAVALERQPVASNRARRALFGLYENGFGVEPNQELADHYLQSAADKGDPSSMFKLALRLIDGAENHSEAYQWAISLLMKAQDVEHNHANKLLKKLRYPARGKVFADD